MAVPKKKTSKKQTNKKYISIVCTLKKKLTRLSNSSTNLKTIFLY
jgi:ribosomal protein L32